MKIQNWGEIKYWALFVCTAILGALIAILWFNQVKFDIHAFQITVELLPFRQGETVIFLPPVGELRANTHVAPFMLQITLLNVDLDLLVANLENLAASQNLVYFEEQLRHHFAQFLARSAVTVCLGSAAAVFLLLREQRWKRVILGGTATAAVYIMLLLSTLIAPYNLDAFENPRYTGIIGAAPWVVNLSEQTLANIKTLGEQLEVMTANLHDLSEQLEQVQPANLPDGLRVLHVSDIHNNPAAFDFIEKVTGSFSIDLIIDTGDLTDYGTELETELVARVSSLPVPYVFVSGNHDSPQVVEAMRREGAIVLENETVEIKGLRISGIADPSADSTLMAIAPDTVLRELGSRAYQALLADKPDIFAAHHPLVAHPFVGKVGVILSGHTHRAQLQFQSGSALINAGTTGAAGLRGLQAPKDNPYSMVVLYFTPDEDGKQFMVMADLLSVHQFQDSFTLQRYYNR